MYVLYTLHLKVWAGTGVGSVAATVVDVSSISFPIVVVILNKTDYIIFTRSFLQHVPKKTLRNFRKDWMIFS